MNVSLHTQLCSQDTHIHRECDATYNCMSRVYASTHYKFHACSHDNTHTHVCTHIHTHIHTQHTFTVLAAVEKGDDGVGAGEEGSWLYFSEMKCRQVAWSLLLAGCRCVCACVIVCVFVCAMSVNDVNDVLATGCRCVTCLRVCDV